jgi:hypothetical protein
MMDTERNRQMATDYEVMNRTKEAALKLLPIDRENWSNEDINLVATIVTDEILKPSKYGMRSLDWRLMYQVSEKQLRELRNLSRSRV